MVCLSFVIVVYNSVTQLLNLPSFTLIYLIYFFDCLHCLFIWLLLFYPLPFFSPHLLSSPLPPPPPSFVKSRTCSFSLFILCMSSYYVIIFLYNFCQAAVSIKISNLFVSVASICLVLYLKKVILSEICIL